jgi:LmbE family N-acetylglucosaminyl deacetylase
MRITKPLLSLVLLFFSFGSACLNAQSIPSSTIYHQLLQLKETKRILYVAAHPDDENTRMIGYLVNGEHAQVAYLSLTRGDGGQNLIGKELGIELGQIRTQELIKARETDGGQQFFTRAMDFGYTKNPTETLQNWEKDKVLSDVVWVIRSFRPDIIITRFNTIPGVTHGQHTTSAILAEEAFELAANPSAYPAQLKFVKTWQPKRLFFNAYNFGGEFEPQEGTNYHIFPVGEFDPILGESYSQIAADSRTMHKSQGFGSTASIGEAKDYIQFLKGEKFTDNPFEGVPNRWNEVDGGKVTEEAIGKAILDFDFKNPSANVPNFLQIRKNLKALKAEEIWIEEKLQRIDNLIFFALGLETEWNVKTELGFPGQEITTELVVNNPSEYEIKSGSMDVFGIKYPASTSEINRNKTERIPIRFILSEEFPLSQPYWLEEPIDGALYSVTNQEDIGKPFQSNQPQGDFSFEMEGQQFAISLGLNYKFNDQVDGEIKQPFTIVPEIDLTVSKENLFLISGADPVLTVTVNFRNQILDGILDFEGLDSTQYRILNIEDNTFQKKRVFQVGFLPNGQGKKVITARYTTDSGKSFDLNTHRISYKHIPNLTYFTPASFNLIQTDWKLSSAKIGYIPGAGDDVPAVLSALGYQVTLIGPEDYTIEYLSQFKAVVVGIRAYNTNSDLSENQQILMGYVKSGGNVIVQYNTSSPLLTNQLGPFPFTIGRDRVTVQGSPVKADWTHPILSTPNQIKEEDFEGWVQERGLYFATDVAEQYSSPLEMQDPDEASSAGALIYVKYGEGTYVYTGISFFRQLPAGVPGAIKLFVNLIEQ